MKNSAPLITLVGFLITAAPATFAASGTWNAGNGTWDTAGNWVGNVIANDSLSTANFTNDITSDTTVSLNSNRTINAIVFGDGNTTTAGSWTIDNNGSAANILTLGGATPTITVNALGTGKVAAISAEIQGTAGLAKNGTGTLVLSGNNSYSGSTVLNAGSLRLANSGALGTSTVSGAGLGSSVLQLSGNITIANSVSLSGTGLNTNGVIENVSGNNTLSNYTLASATGTRIGVSTGSTLNITNNITVAGNASATTGFRFLGGGSLVLSGNNSAVWANSIVTNTIGLTGAGGLAIKLGSDTALGASTINFDANSTLQSVDATARSTAASLAFTSSATNVTLGAASTGNLTISGNVTVATAIGLTINNTQTTLSGVVSGSTGSLSKAGTGTLVLSGSAANTFNGTTTVSAGVLNLNKTAGINAVGGNLSIQSGGKVSFSANNQIADSAIVSITGNGSILNGTAVNTGVFAPTETIAGLNVTGGGFQSGGGAVWTVTGNTSFTGGIGTDTFFAAYSGSSFTTKGLSLTSMTGTSGSSLGTAGFYLYGNSNAALTTVTVGSDGLTLNGSVVNLRKGTSAGALGSSLRLNGNVTTTGTAASSIVEDPSGLTTNGTVTLALGGTDAGPVNRTFNIGSSANLTIGVGITNGASSAASLTKTGAGTLVLSNANTFNGSTSITGGSVVASAINSLGGTTSLSIGTGAILEVRASGAVNDTAGVTLDGGTILRGAGFSETFGSLLLTSDSFIDFGTGAVGTLSFGSYDNGSLPTKFKLSVNNFLIGNTLTFQQDLSGSITDTNLFAFDNAFTSSWNGSTFTITAIPEPSTMYSLVVAGGLMVLLHFRRRRRA